MATSSNSIQLLNTYNVKTMEQIRDSYLQTYSNALINVGIVNPDVGVGTAIYIHATALATELAALGYNQQLLANASLPDSAQGNDLIRQAELVDLTLQPAVGSVGQVKISTTLTPSSFVPILTGTQLTDINGLKYQVTTGGSFQDSSLGGSAGVVQISAINVGPLTNHEDGDILTWVQTPGFLTNTVVVFGGLSGGSSAESIEDLRSRVEDAWKSPSVDGNATQINQWAEQASPVVQKSFAYPIAGGPGSIFLRLVQAAPASSITRTISDPVIIANIKSYVEGLLPEYVELDVQSVVQQACNVSFGLSLSGGNWLGNNGLNLFPIYNHDPQFYADVTAVIDNQHFTVNSDFAPVAQQSQICWFSPVDYKFYKSTVQSYTGSGPYAVTIGASNIGDSAAFPNIAIGHWISPMAANSQQYFASLFSQIQNLGPGEMTNQAALLPSAFRIPNTNLSWPAQIGPSILKFIVGTGAEILDVQYLFRTDLGAGPGQPTLPANVSLPANILVAGNLAIYPILPGVVY